MLGTERVICCAGYRKVLGVGVDVLDDDHIKTWDGTGASIAPVPLASGVPDGVDAERSGLYAERYATAANVKE